MEYPQSPSMNQSFTSQQQKNYNIMNQQPGSIPSLLHTPIQVPQSQQAPCSVAPAPYSRAAVYNSGGNDPLNTSSSFYMAAHSVPTPSR